MSVLTIQGPAERGRDAAQVSLRHDESATFGVCGCSACALDLRLPAHVPVHFRGRISAGHTRWRIENLSSDGPLVVSDVDRGLSTMALPGESIPFTQDMAIVTPFDPSRGVSVTVFFSPSSDTTSIGTCCPAIRPRLEPALDPNARYFAVLAALCEGELADGPAAPVPTSSSIARQLALSPRAVDAHIDYLVDKFEIPAPATRGTGWKRRALITYVRGHDNVARVLRRHGRAVRAVPEQAVHGRMTEQRVRRGAGAAQRPASRDGARPRGGTPDGAGIGVSGRDAHVRRAGWVV